MIQPETGCFVGETPVLTDTGYRAIQTLRPGDRVWAFGHEANAWSLRVVRGVHDQIYEGPRVEVDIKEGGFTATVDHPVWIDGGRDAKTRPDCRELEPGEDEEHALPGRWVNSQDLLPGDTLVSRTGERRVVTAVRMTYASALPVFNLTVDEDHTYAVGTAGVLVHNVPCRGGFKGDNGPDVESAVAPGDRGTFGDLKNQKRRSGQTEPVEIDHQPSFAAQKKAREDALGEKLSKEELAELRRSTPAVASPTDIHRESRTFGGRNTADQIAEDAEDLDAAEALDRSLFEQAMRDR